MMIGPKKEIDQVANLAQLDRVEDLYRAASYSNDTIGE